MPRMRPCRPWRSGFRRSGRLWTVVVALAIGCQQTYAGTFLIAPDGGRAIELPGLAATVDEIASEFGFRRQPTDRESRNNWVVWGKVAPGLDRYGDLAGSTARVWISARADASTVSIRDYDHSSETEFVRQLRERLASKLEATCGAERVRFERRNDWLS